MIAAALGPGRWFSPRSRRTARLHTQPGRSAPSRRTAGSSQTGTRLAGRTVPQGRADPPRRLGSMSAGSERLARAVWLVDQGADTLERTRRAQYRG